MTEGIPATGTPTVRVLGGMTAEIDGRPIDLGGPRQRAVLGLLLVARGKVVSANHIAQELWGDEPPGNPAGVLQSYISHLRRALEPGSLARSRSGVLVSEGRGYACRLPDDAVDAWRFEDLVRAGVALGEDGAAVVPLRTALDLWRGRPYADHATQPWADAEAARLDGIRGLAVEHLAAARLAAGEAAGLVPELETMVDADPLREDRWRLLALALYRAGRQADALAALRRARSRLVDELGVSPGPALQALESQILAQDPRLVSTPAPTQQWIPQPRSAPPAAAAVGHTSPARPVEPAGPSEPARPSAPARPAEPPGPAGDDLVERRAEMSLLAGALQDALAGTGGLAIIEGPPGIGKTRLASEVRRLAQQHGARTLSARGSVLERGFAFGGVRQLMEPLLADPGEGQRLLSGAAAPAAPVFDLTVSIPGAEASADASFSILYGLYWLVVRAAERGPLLLTVDDLQWCDAGTQRFLAFLVRRVADLPILVLATRRTGESNTDEEALSDLAHGADGLVIEPPPLTQAGVATLVAMRLGEPDEVFVSACRRTTGGNPLLLRQLLRALEAERVVPDAAHADTVNAIGSRAVASVVLRRLTALGPEVTEIAKAVAVLGDGCSLAMVAAMTGMYEDAAAQAAARAADAEILRDAHPLGFVHPVVREAIYQGIPAIRRGLAHEQAAALLIDLDADPELVAAHLLLAPARGDDLVVENLVRAAEVARDRGSSESAASYLNRALAEPPGPAQRAEVLAQLGLVEAVSDGPSAVAHLLEAYRELPGGRLAAEVGFAAALTMVFAGAPGSATAFAFEAADRLPGERVDERQRLEAVGRTGGYMHGLDPSVWRDRPAVVEGTGVGARMLASYLGWERLMVAGDHREAVRLARFALEGSALVEVDPGLFWVTSSFVLSASDVDLTAFWADMRARAHARGSLFTALSTNVWQAHDEWWHGDLRDAERLLRISQQQALEWGTPVVATAYIEAFLIQVLLTRGDLAGARALIDQVAATPRFGEGQRLFSEAVALVLIAEGRAVEALEAAAVVEQIMPHVENPVYRPWRSVKARAVFALGRTDQAVDLVTDELEVARRWGAPRLIGRTLRLRGRFRGSDGRDDLAEAVALLETTTASAELARALVGMAATESPARAVALMTRACELAQSCGADGVRQGCVDRLLAFRAPVPELPPGLDRLTGSERRATTLLGAGLDVTEIAERLLATPQVIRDTLASARDRLGLADDRALRALVTAGHPR